MIGNGADLTVILRTELPSFAKPLERLFKKIGTACTAVVLIKILANGDPSLASSAPKKAVDRVEPRPSERTSCSKISAL